MRFVFSNEMFINFFSSISIRVMSALTVFFFSIYLTNTLGAEQVGYFFLMQAFITVLSAVSRRGFDNTLVKYIGIEAGKPNFGNSKKIAKYVFLLIIPISFVVGGVLFCSSSLLSSWINKAAFSDFLKIAAPGVLFFSINFTISVILQGIGYVNVAIICQNISYYFFTIMLVLVFELDSSFYIALAFVISLCINCFLFGCYLYMKLSGSKSLDFNFNEFVASANLNYVSSILVLSFTWGSVIVAGMLLPSSEVAEVAIVQRVSLLISFVFISVNMIYAPKVAKLFYEEEFIAMRLMILKKIKGLILVSLPVFCVFFLFPDFILGFFGDEFVYRSPLLLILLIPQIALVVTGNSSYILLMTGYEKDIRTANVLGFFIGLPILAFTTFYWGIWGFCYSLSLVTTIIALYNSYLVKVRLDFNIYNHLYKG